MGNNFLDTYSLTYKATISCEGKVSKEYKAWLNMRSRCYNSKDISYPRYGGRGITVCERWVSSFMNFLSDMRISPSCDHSVERLENDKMYSPANCKWATRKQQMNNTSQNHVIEFCGMKKTLTVWSKIFNLNPQAVNKRINRGWHLADAFGTPSCKISKKDILSEVQSLRG